MSTTRDLLSLHETVAQYDGNKEQKCFFMTSLCPYQCDHGGTTAVFSIKKYIKYEKPGQYGDAKSDKHYARLSDRECATGLTKERLEVFKTLSPGEFVMLSWNHDYVHNNGSSYPERPITKLEKISDGEAGSLIAQQDLK